MEYRKLGSSGLEVSRFCLGCMSFGKPQSGDHTWTLDEDAARPIIRRALEGGVNFFDTANGYSAGTSEEILGSALAEFAQRDEVVVATKVHSRMHSGPNADGLSRKSIMAEVDNSLRRLGTDYIDLYQIHRFDPMTPIEETLEALNDVVHQGKARYIGASSMFSWQFSKMLHTSDIHGWSRFISMQDHYNLLYREEEREMLPLCQDQGVGAIPWSPLARGRLTREWEETTARSQTDDRVNRYPESDRPIVERVAEVAKHHGVPRAQVALAWLFSKPVVAAPIVGVTKMAQLEDALSASSVELSAEEIDYLESPYEAHPVEGHTGTFATSLGHPRIAARGTSPVRRERRPWEHDPLVPRR